MNWLYCTGTKFSYGVPMTRLTVIEYSVLGLRDLAVQLFSTPL